MTGTEQVLVEDWCQQYPEPLVGTVAFGRDGALYASGGDGASFNFADYGQDGAPVNPCGDPPGGVGATLTPPTAEGGALRSQDLRTAGDPVEPGRHGHPRRPRHRRRAAGQPARRAAPTPTRGASSPTACATPSASPCDPAPTSSGSATSAGTTGRRSTGIAARPTPVENFGWPCYEGVGPPGRLRRREPQHLREPLRAPAGAVTAPYFTYHHNGRVVPSETCPTGSSSVAGLAFAFDAARARTRPSTTARCSSPTTRATASG